MKDYFFDGFHKFSLALLDLNLIVLLPYLSQISILPFFSLIFDDFADGIKMIVLEDIFSEFLEILSTERASMVPVDCLLDAFFAVDMSASRDVTILDLV